MNTNGHYDILLLCPVRNISDETRRALMDHTKKLESEGKKVYTPLDSKNGDVNPYTTTESLIRRVNRLDVYWDPNSLGLRVAMGMGFMIETIEEVKLINEKYIKQRSQENTIEERIIEWAEGINQRTLSD